MRQSLHLAYNIKIISNVEITYLTKFILISIRNKKY